MPATDESAPDQTKELLASLLDYVTHMVRLGERPVFAIEQHRNLILFENELQGRVGVQHDLDDGGTWLKIERLRRIEQIGSSSCVFLGSDK